jgi:hypothetical protein
VNGTTTHLIGALIGKSFDLNNSAWPGYSGGTSRCVVDGFHHALAWPSGLRPGLIVRTQADGFRYVFEPYQILPSFGKKARVLAEKELEILKLRARVEKVGFSSPSLDLEPPPIPTTHSALDPELRQLLKFVWLSDRGGKRWPGTAGKLDSAFDSAKRAYEHAHGRPPQVQYRSGRVQDRRGRARAEDESRSPAGLYDHNFQM